MKPKTTETEINESESAPNSEVTPSKEEGTAPSGGGSYANLDTIADNLSQSMPEVQEHALEQEKLNESDKLAQFSHLKDSDGNSFDPSIHKTKKDGEPTLTKLGKLIKRPANQGGRKKSTGSVVGGVNSAVDKDAQVRMQARASGTMAANLILSVGMAIGGEEWQPVIREDVGLNEKMSLENAFADYFEATGKTDIPPGMALTVAIGAYALPRFTLPKTQKRVGKVKMFFKQWLINRKLKKHGMKAAPINEDKKEEK